MIIRIILLWVITFYSWYSGIQMYKGKMEIMKRTKIFVRCSGENSHIEENMRIVYE